MSGDSFLTARARTHSARAYTVVCVSAHRPSTPKPYIHYVRSSSVCVGKCSVRRVLYTLSSTRNHGLTLNMSVPQRSFRFGLLPLMLDPYLEYSTPELVGRVSSLVPGLGEQAFFELREESSRAPGSHTVSSYRIQGRAPRDS